MHGFTPAFQGLYTDDIIEFVNIPYTDWPELLTEHPRFRIKHDTEDDFGYEQVVKVREGLIIRTLDLLILRDNTVPVSTLSDYISFYFYLNGDCLISRDEEEHSHNTGACGIFYAEESIGTEDFSRAGVKYDFIEVLISRDIFFKEFFPQDLSFLPKVLSPVYEKNKNFVYDTLALDVEAFQAVNIFATTAYQGVIRDKFFEAKAIELICLMLRVLLRKEQEVPHKPIASRDAEMLERARAMIEKDLSNPPTIDEISQTLGVGKSVFQERFKQLFGMSLRQFLVKKRMEKAKDLLGEADLNINQISWQLGYEHSCNFVTAFKRQYGVTPKAYRKLEFHIGQ